MNKKITSTKALITGFILMLIGILIQDFIIVGFGFIIYGLVNLYFGD